MINIELIYDQDCPNVEATRAALRAALREQKLNLNWKERDRNDPLSPEYARNYGSPTILINGNDIAGSNSTSADNCCRVYKGEDGAFSGVPSVQLIKRGLLGAQQPPLRRATLLSQWKGLLPTVPAIGAVLVPGLTCPACWPAYAGLLGSFGLGFINYTPFLLPLTALFLVLALSPLIYKATRGAGYKALLLGSVGAVLTISARFIIDLPSVMYVGITLLIVASIFNAFPKRKVAASNCTRCTNGESR